MENIREKKSRLIFNGILEDIKSNKLKKGEVLPSEADYARQYNCGRGSVREAMQVLEFLGMLRKQAGVGTTVENFSLDSVFNPAGIYFELDSSVMMQVVEFREIFEEIITQKLCSNIEKEDLEAVEEILALNKFYFERNNYEKYSEYDYKFHRALAYATRNIVIENIFNLIFPFLKYMTDENIKNPQNLDETLRDHSDLIESIKNRDARQAKKVIGRHIEHIKSFL